jgi:hypothetical protein
LSDIRAIRIIFQERVEEGPGFASSAEPHIDGAELECGGPVGRCLFEHGFEDSGGFVELIYFVKTGRFLLLGIDRLNESNTKKKGKGHLKHD